MASLVTTLPPVMFPYELNQLEVAASADVAVKITYADKTLLDSVMTPYNGHVYLYNMATHIIDYIGSELATLSIYLDGTLVASTSILPNSMGVSAAASECYKEIFLSRASCRYTYPAAKELLHFVSDGETSATVRAVAIKDGLVVTSEQQLAITLPTGIVTLDVSPNALFSLVDYTLVEYAVSIGARTMKFRMLPDGLADTIHEYGYINSYMQEEYITLMGEAERDVKVERRHAYVAGQLRNFHVEAFPHWSIQTHITDGMAGMFDDFVSAKDIWRKEDGCVLAITDSENKTSSLTSAMNMGSITLREAGRIYIHQPVRPIRTFDSTFDDTFQ